MTIPYPSNQTLPAFGTAAFGVAASGDPPLSFQWRRNETNLTGRTDAILTLTNVQPADAGHYTVVVSNPAASVTSSNALLRVLVSPSIFNVGQTTTLSFSFASEDALKYFIEYKSQLSDPSWSPLRAETGNGGVISITDTIGPELTRFYRIRVE